MSYYAMAFTGLAPFGSLLAGTVADYIGAPDMLLLTGACCVAGAVWFATQLPAIRQVVRPDLCRAWNHSRNGKRHPECIGSGGSCRVIPAEFSWPILMAIARLCFQQRSPGPKLGSHFDLCKCTLRNRTLSRVMRVPFISSPSTISFHVPLGMSQMSACDMAS